MHTLCWNDVCVRRLARHSLVDPAPSARMVAVVHAVCGLQAQILTAAELGLGTRIAGATQRDVRAELWEHRRLVKTYGPRGTLHLLPADELPLWMAAMRGRASRRETHWYEDAGLERAQAEGLIAAIGEALDGRCLTREELADAVAGRVGAWARARLMSMWGELLAPAAYAGLLCFGPSRGSNVTFVRADQWIGGWEECDPDAALSKVCRRYFAAYGPATHQDFARWFALTPDEALGVMASLGEVLEEVAVEGKRAWALAADAEAPSDGDARSVRLLPQYDCYVLGCGQRERILPAAARPRVRAHGRGRYEGVVGLPVLLIDGVVAGMWERRRHGARIAVRVEPFVPITAARERQIEAEAARIGAFVGAEATLSFGALG